MIAEINLDALESLETADLEARTKIVDWGKWSRGGIPGTRQRRSPDYDISDDEALLVERQVARLKGRPRYIIRQIYLGGRGINDLAASLGVSNRQIMKYRDQGLNIIYGGLQEVSAFRLSEE